MHFLAFVEAESALPQRKTVNNENAPKRRVISESAVHLAHLRQIILVHKKGVEANIIVQK